MASDSAALGWLLEERERDSGRKSGWGSWCAAFVLAAALLGGVIGLGSARGERVVEAAPAVQATEWPKRPLGPEWGWAGRQYDFRGMFPSRRDRSRGPVRYF